MNLALSAFLAAGLVSLLAGWFVLRRVGWIVSHLRFTFSTPFARRTLWVVGALVVALGSGAVVAHLGLGRLCSDWPLCTSDRLLPTSLLQWVNMGHRLIVLLIGIGWLLYWGHAFTLYPEKMPIVLPATLVTVLYLAQALLGQKLVESFAPFWAVFHQLTFLGLWIAATVLVVGVGRSGLSLEDEVLRSKTNRWRWSILVDFLRLTKPVVVALLLVTTYAGMVVGGQQLPALDLTFWTLFGGFLAAGGASAINQYLDREEDRKMQRTQKRPIPSGRLTPAQGLAFGAGLSLLSFYLLLVKVNLIAALLSLAGWIYYVLIYSLWLKKATPQNIVIGGGAGAIPPLVGWAAATGDLQLPALLLFAVIFLWTPPHFWALALVRKKDYARAGVPMLPVVRGERETRRQIFLYTLELVGLTLLLPLFGLGGGFTLAGAALLGLWLLSSAWKVWRQEGNKVAWRMYRYSSMYLAFLFAILVLDALL
ncbi:MAG: heme o synthase [Anaerolineales bacterium]|nr:heme o synthase [Anaerolineales bacterium]MCS7247811.1 heme o synthase [Anaerolineales bacterium]MDW8161621.1 heme o synthase [Anaerolineales bacterium]MDW8446311.1 heme o synthase [Anaerolineales bacterium]